MEDKISALPDDILRHILSFLPTQNAVATTVLSKAWRFLGFSLSTLYFDDQTYLISHKPYSSFQQFVRTITLQQPRITSFRLKTIASQFKLLSSDFNEWIEFAMQRGVQILDIHLAHPFAMLNLNFRVLSCRTLVVLKLKGWLCVDTPNIDFPSLKTLILDAVDFIEPQYLMEFLHGCPNLEFFEAKNIEYYFHNDYSYDGGVFSLPTLIGAKVYNVELGFHLKAICNAQTLRLDKCAGVIPVFPNLTYMELVFEGDINWIFVFAMLEKCPNLQVLVLDKLKHLKTSDDVVCFYPSVVPQCLSSHLRKCVIANYGGTKGEQQFVQYIMENSTPLQTMTIRMHFPS